MNTSPGNVKTEKVALKGSEKEDQKEGQKS